MSDQGVDPMMQPPAGPEQAMPMPEQQFAPGPQAPPVPPTTQEEIVAAIASAARAASMATGPTAAEDVWHFGQGAFYFAQALGTLMAPADSRATETTEPEGPTA